MFAGSSGSIPNATTQANEDQTTLPVFSPESREELKSAVEEYLHLSAKGVGSHGLHGSIGEWDVSRVTDMRSIFAVALAFNEDISKWDVSRVKDMSGMFAGAFGFNGDLSNSANVL